MPTNISDLLDLLQVLLIYGRHLSFTLEHRAVARGFSTIAQYFGTARLPVIRARLARGFLRVVALQRVLLDRARRGRDLVFLHPRRRTPRKPPVRPDAGAPQGGAKPPRYHPPRRPDLQDVPDPDNLPTVAQLEAEIRRHPIGEAVADICRDFGIAFGLCDRRFGFALFETITWFRGNLPRFSKDFLRREVAFEPEADGTPPLCLPEQTAEATRRMLGFFIGEQWPVTPSWVCAPGSRRAATGTGPP